MTRFQQAIGPYTHTPLRFHKSGKAAISSFASATMSGVKSGKVGEPFERDLRQRDESKKIQTTLPRLSPAFELYDYVRRSAERDIAAHSRDFEASEEE